MKDLIRCVLVIGISTFSTICWSQVTECGDSIQDKDGNYYSTQQYGTQCWMTKNLNVGKMLTSNEVSSDNKVIEKYCQKDDLELCNKYGGLYSWKELMAYGASDNKRIGTTQGICPLGWHIPTDEEWKVVERYFGMAWSESDREGWRGKEQYVGHRMKSKDYWWKSQETNSPIKDYNHFSIVPAGKFMNNPGNATDFSGKDMDAFFWTATKVNEYDTWFRHLEAVKIDIERKLDTPSFLAAFYCYSVRCIKDQ